MKNANAKKAAELVGKAHSALSEKYKKTKNSTKKDTKLIGNQYKLDVNKNGKIDAEDLAMIRGEKMGEGGGVDKWQGVDKDLVTSLEEYGFVATQKPDKDYEDEWFVIYKVDDGFYDAGYIRESELDALVDGADWMSEEDIKSFLETSGYESAKDFKESAYFINKLSDLMSYYGHENFFGTAYMPWDKEQTYSEIGIDYAERGKNVKGSKHVHLTKGYRNPHGYKAVKGSEKNKDYSKGHPHIKVDKGFAMPHGYEAVDGTYNKKYETGGEFDKANFREGEKVKVNGKVGTIVRYDKSSDSYVVYTGKYESEFYSPEQITKYETGGGVTMMIGDMVKIMPNHTSHYTNQKAEIVKIMPDGKTYEVKIKHKNGNEYVKFEKDELVFLGNEPRFDRGGGVHKHVSVKRGYRLPHGYQAVRGATKKADYSHKGVEMDLGWRLPHGYVLEKGADSKAYYKRGGGVESCTPEEKMFVRALIERYMDNLSSDGKEVATSVLHKLK
jgi:hypothetical protein